MLSKEVCLAGYDPKAYWTFVPLPSAGSEQQAAASPDVSVADQSSPLVLHPSVPIVADVYTSTATPALSASLASADQQPVDSLAASAAAQPAIDATARANKSTSSGRFDNKQLRAVTAPKADATALDAVNSPWSIKTAAQPVPQDQEAALGVSSSQYCYACCASCLCLVNFCSVQSNAVLHGGSSSGSASISNAKSSFPVQRCCKIMMHVNFNTSWHMCSVF